MRLTITARADDFLGARVRGATSDDAARLIAAAPELLAALIAIRTTRPRDNHGRISYKAAYEAMLRQARAAIATATGEGQQ